MKIKALMVLLTLLFLAGCGRITRQDISKAYPQSNYSNIIASSQLTDGYWQIWTSKLDGSQAKQVTFSASDKRCPVWGLDGRTIYFRNNNRQLFKVETGNSQTEQQILGQLGDAEDLVFANDGSIVFVRFRTQYRDSANVWMADANGDNCRMLTRQSSLQYNPAISPDSQKLIYVASNGHHHTDELYLMDIRDRKNIQLTNNDYQEIHPVFSPDGSKIAYSSDISGDFEIWTMDSDGNNKKQLTSTPGLDNHPEFSADGKIILYVSNSGGQLHPAIMNTDGANQMHFKYNAPTIDATWKRGNL